MHNQGTGGFQPHQPAHSDAVSVYGENYLTTLNAANGTYPVTQELTVINPYDYMTYYAYENQNPLLRPERAQLEAVPRCHLHKKPDLHCKFCRKYKSAIHELNRLVQKQQPVVEEKKYQVPMTNTSTYNLNNLLRNNILSSEYYKSLASLSSYVDVVNELIQFADHVEPYCTSASKAPSTFFCCLHKLFTMRLTEKQMSSLLDNKKSPYPRCCGFLYLRYVLPADQLWKWFEPYFLDDEPVTVTNDRQREITVGEYAEKLLIDDKYFNTVLPRLPVKFKNLFGAQLLDMREHRRRRMANLEIIGEFGKGEPVSACSKGDWLDGTILSLSNGRDGYPKVRVLLEDGVEELLDIAFIILKSGQRADRRHRSRHRSRSCSDSLERHVKYRKRFEREESPPRASGQATREELMRDFRRREKDKALAVGRDYARRPTAYKRALSSRMDCKSGYAGYQY